MRFQQLVKLAVAVLVPFWNCLVWVDHLLWKIKLVFCALPNDLKLADVTKILEGRQVFILANGPSVALVNQDSYNSLPSKVDCCITLNKAIDHPLLPTDHMGLRYHVIIDSKFRTGQWEFNILKKILQKTPNTIFVLNFKWQTWLELIDFLADTGASVYWIDSRLLPGLFGSCNIARPCAGLSVSGAAILLGQALGAKNIVCFGMESDGLIRELIDEKSHFYGVDAERRCRPGTGLVDDLFSMCITLHLWRRKIQWLSAKGVTIEINPRQGILARCING